MTRRTPPAGECRQMGVGHLAITDDQQVVVDERYVVSGRWLRRVVPRVVRRLRPDRAGKYFWVRRRPHEAGFGERASRPASVALACHSRIGGGGCVSPRQRDQCVDVEQRHCGSQARRTISGVIGGVPAGTRITGGDVRLDASA